MCGDEDEERTTKNTQHDEPGIRLHRARRTDREFRSQQLQHGSSLCPPARTCTKHTKEIRPIGTRRSRPAKTATRLQDLHGQTLLMTTMGLSPFLSAFDKTNLVCVIGPDM